MTHPQGRTWAGTLRQDRVHPDRAQPSTALMATSVVPQADDALCGPGSAPSDPAG